MILKNCRSARSIKLLNDVDLSNDGANNEGDAMMIVAFGKAFTVAEEVPKKQIMNTLARDAIQRCCEFHFRDRRFHIGFIVYQLTAVWFSRCYKTANGKKHQL